MVEEIRKKRNLRSEGSRAEDMAVGFLEREGYRIVERNFHFGRSGEIDIIAREGGYLVFCEVKMRKNDEFGPPEYAVTPQKQRTIRRVAHGYLYVAGIKDQACRFDVVIIRIEREGPVCALLRNAF